MIKEPIVILVSSIYSGSQSGKNTFTNFMVDYLLENNKNDFSIFVQELSDPIKYFCLDVLGIDANNIYVNKNNKTGISIKNFKENATSREIMQYYGTEICRETFGENIFVNRILNNINKKTANTHNGQLIIFVPDLRFDNEYIYLKENGINPILIDINRTSQSNKDTHISQQGIQKIKDSYNFNIQNELGLEELKEKARQTIKIIISEKG